MTTLQRVKTLLNITDTSKDALLTELISGAEEFAKTYCNNADVVSLVGAAIVQMVVYAYNRIGSEGLTSENYSGVAFGYTDGYPDDIMKQLRRYRKIGVIRNDD